MVEEVVKNSESTRLQLNSAVFMSPGMKEFLLFQPMQASVATYRKIAIDPTVGLALDYCLSSILSAGEVVESDDDVSDDQIKFISRQWDSIKRKGIYQMLRDSYALGWAVSEKIWELDGKGHACLRLKSLEATITGILVDPSTGNKSGVVQPLVMGMASSPTMGMPVKLDMLHCAIFSWAPIGSQWYGESTLERARQAYNDCEDAAHGARRFDKYLAGGHFCITYPDGVMVDLNGTQVTAAEAATFLLEQLESSGAICIPSPVQNIVGQLSDQTNGGWHVEILSDGTSRQPGFTNRFEYTDKLKVRALGIPERSVLEGQNGTKAEAGVHGDVGSVNLEFRHRWLIDNVNEQIIDDLLEQNYGAEFRGKIRLVPVPMQKADLAVAGEVYKSIVGTEGSQEASSIDMAALRQALQIPCVDEISGGVEDIQDGNANPAIADKVSDTVGIVGVAQSGNF
jgi:hypothetical protein